jgi:hypothetical protein
MKTIALSVLALMLAAANAWADAPQVGSVALTNYGIYTGDVARNIADATMPTGYRTDAANIHFTETTDTVVGRVGEAVGVEWRVDGAPQGAPLQVEWVIRVPDPGMRSPQGETTHIAKVPAGEIIGKDFAEGYRFDNAWEIVPGVWTFELWYGDRKLASKSLTVVAASK